MVFRKLKPNTLQRISSESLLLFHTRPRFVCISIPTLTLRHSRFLSNVRRAHTRSLRAARLKLCSFVIMQWQFSRIGFVFYSTLPQFQFGNSVYVWRCQIACSFLSIVYTTLLLQTNQRMFCFFRFFFSCSLLSSQRAMYKLSPNHRNELYICFFPHYFHYSYYVSGRCAVIVVYNVQIWKMRGKKWTQNQK